jgi:hypothetical protein
VIVLYRMLMKDRVSEMRAIYVYIAMELLENVGKGIFEIKGGGTRDRWLRSELLKFGGH